MSVCHPSFTNVGVSDQISFNLHHCPCPPARDWYCRVNGLPAQCTSESLEVMLRKRYHDSVCIEDKIAGFQ